MDLGHNLHLTSSSLPLQKLLEETYTGKEGSLSFLKLSERQVKQRPHGKTLPSQHGTRKRRITEGDQEVKDDRDVLTLYSSSSMEKYLSRPKVLRLLIKEAKTLNKQEMEMAIEMERKRQEDRERVKAEGKKKMKNLKNLTKLRNLGKSRKQDFEADQDVEDIKHLRKASSCLDPLPSSITTTSENNQENNYNIQKNRDLTFDLSTIASVDEDTEENIGQSPPSTRPVGEEESAGDKSLREMKTATHIKVKEAEAGSESETMGKGEIDEGNEKERMSLPLYKLLSPRMKKRLAMIPPPTEEEKEATEKLMEKVVDKQQDKQHPFLRKFHWTNREKIMEEEQEREAKVANRILIPDIGNVCGEEGDFYVPPMKNKFGIFVKKKRVNNQLLGHKTLTGSQNLKAVDLDINKQLTEDLEKAGKGNERGLSRDFLLTKLLSIGADVGGKDSFPEESTAEKLSTLNAGKPKTSLLCMDNLLNSREVEQDTKNFQRTSHLYENHIVSQVEVLRAKLREEAKEFSKTSANLEQSHQVVADFDAGLPYVEPASKGKEEKPIGSGEDSLSNSELTNLEESKVDLIENMCYILEYFHAKCAKSYRLWIWKKNVQKMTFIIQHKAVVKLQTRAKIKMDQESLQNLKKAYRLKVEKGRKTRATFMDMREAKALTIQRLWRSYWLSQSIKKKVRERKAAILIWNNYKIFDEFRGSMAATLIAGKRGKAVLLIQSVWRGYRDRVRYQLLRKCKIVEDKLNELKLRDEGRMYVFEKLGATSTIQIWWRKYLAKKKRKALLSILRNEKATTINKWIRRFNAQCLLYRLAEEKYNREYKLQFSALTIQKNVKRFLAKREWERMMFEKNKQLRVHRIEKDRIIEERLSHHFFGLWVVDHWKRAEQKQRMKEYFDLYNCDKEDAAAVNIQRVYRGHLGRRKKRYFEEIEGLRLLMKKQDLRIHVATRLQSIYRGKKARLVVNYKRQNLYIVKVQKRIRGSIARKKYERMLQLSQVATIVQKFVRRWLCKKEYSRLRLEFRIKSNAAILLQCFLKGSIARLKYREKQLYLRRVTERYYQATILQDLRYTIVKNNLLVDSLESGYKYKVKYHYRQKARENPEIINQRKRHHGDGKVFQGEMQKIFSHFSQYDEREDKLDNLGFINLLNSSELINNSFSTMDADLMFARMKSQAGKFLTFSAFNEILDILGVTIYPDLEHFYYFKGKKGRKLKVIHDKFLKQEWCTPYRHMLEDRMSVRLNLMWIRIQSLVRMFVSRRKYLRMLANLEKDKLEKFLNNQAIVIQSFIRGRWGRWKGVKHAEKIYRKYKDPKTGAPYYYNPRKKRTIWTKPYIFGTYFDVPHVTVLPSAETEMVIMCVNCQKELGEKSCEQCEEVFCTQCYDAVHCKGARMKHVATQMPHCRDCKYQLATKQCVQCSFKEGKGIYYCDICFLNNHPKPQPLPNGKLPRRHTYDALVLTCVECEYYAAKWRCEDCNDVFCTKCFSRIHARGKKMEHKVNTLRYYTPQMHKAFIRYMYDVERAKIMKKKMAEVRRIMAIRKAECALTIQRYYRGHREKKIGMKVIRAGRVKRREIYFERRVEDPLRSKEVYRYLNYWGLANPLYSDTMEEKVLFRFRKSKREKLRQLIRKNYEFYPGQNQNPKKVPKRGFDFGLERELYEQCVFGGVRLPGYFKIEEGERILQTNLDFRKYLNKKARLRIKNLIFSIDDRRGIEEKEILLNRLWRSDDLEKVCVYQMPDLTWWGKVGNSIKIGLLNASFPTQMLISGFTGIEDRIVALLERSKLTWKKIGMGLIVPRIEAARKSLEKRSYRHKLLFKSNQSKYTQKAAEVKEVIDNSASIMKEKAEQRKKETENKYLAKEEREWIDGRDERSGKKFWKNSNTGEIVYDDPYANGSSSKMTEAQRQTFEAKKRREEAKAKRNKVRK